MLIVNYVMDALRADHLSCYGFPDNTTPNIDDFCEDAVRYTNAYAPAPWTKPSAAALLSGLYPRSIDMHRFDDSLPSEIKLLPHRLQDADFETIGVVANAFVTPYFGFGGFDTFHSLLEDENLLGNRRQAKEDITGNTAERLKRMGVDVPIVPLSADINDRLIPDLDGESDDTFVLAWSVDTHGPYFPREGDSFFGNNPDDIIFESDVNGDNIQKVRSLYKDMIRYNDQQFQALLEHLRNQGLYEDALIIVTGDHGEAFADHSVFPNTPIVGHSGIPWEERVHIPLLVKYPEGKFAGEKVNRLVSLIDIASTVADAAGIKMETQGYSLMPDANVEQDRVVLIESRKDPNRTKFSAIRKGDHKFISVDHVLGKSPRNVAVNLLNRIRFGDELYYDLSSDSGETEGRSDSQPDRTDELNAELIKIIESCNKKKDSIDDLGTRGVNDEVKSQLQRLGYFEE